jgi:Fic family protein
MEIYKLSRPAAPRDWDKTLEKALKQEDLASFIERTNKPRYLYWDKVRYLPRPEGMSPEEFWALVKLFRRHSPSRVTTTVKDNSGTPFFYQPLPELDFFLHEVDMRLGGALETSMVSQQQSKQRFITRGIMEEAIASSQLEGANTTRKAAKKMLIEQRKPRNKSEQMILNNYNAMREVEGNFSNQELSLGLLLNLHAILTKDTIGVEETGRLRADRDDIVVGDPASDVIYHIPPKTGIMKNELTRLIKYANGQSKGSLFVHPLIKAIILHFWIGYLHPFTDGNGRIARTIFYWYLLRQGYWAFAYLPVSKMMRNSPVQYRDAYIYAEQDDNDLTYFIDYNICKLDAAKRDFEEYVKRSEIESRRMTEVAQTKYGLNERQIQVLKYLNKNTTLSTSIKTHAAVNSISRLTARKDLEHLEALGFLASTKEGRERPFRITSKLTQLVDLP